MRRAWIAWTLLALACEPLSPEEKAKRDAEYARWKAEADARAIEEAAPLRAQLCTKSAEGFAAGPLFTREPVVSDDVVRVYVNPGVWAQLDLTERTGAGGWLSYCLEPTVPPKMLVRFMHPNTGRELGQWSTLLGYESGDE